MKSSLQPGLSYQHQFKVPSSKTVPALYPEAEEFLVMPAIFATGYLVGLLEWACIKLVNPYLDWPQQQTLGTHIDVSHQAPTPVGLTVTATVTLIEVDDRRLLFAVEAHDDIDLIAKGRHQRFIIDRQRFDKKISQKSLRR